MKKIFILIVVVYLITTFFIIGNKKENRVIEKSEERYIYFSYIEFSDLIKGKSVSESKKEFTKIIENIKDNNFTDVIVHVRAFSDSFYNSSIFPTSRYLSSKEGEDFGYDVLEYLIDIAHKQELRIHAWINPYRIRNNTDVSSISQDNPAIMFLQNNNAHIIENEGIFYNPASSEVIDLIVKGVSEIVRNYKVDGIHLDDYFYPNNAKDLDNYNEYIENGGTLSLEEYRLNNTTTLIKKIYDTIKSINKNVVFGIAPVGNNENNYNSHYLDVYKILGSSGYVDYIMPQLYYGFNNGVKPFIETLNEWDELIKVDTIKLIPALTLHKSGNLDNYAKEGKEEWLNETDIIKRQIIISRLSNHYSGFSIFRYNYFYNSDITNSNLQKEILNIKEVLTK